MIEILPKIYFMECNPKGITKYKVCIPIYSLGEASGCSVCKLGKLAKQLLAANLLNPLYYSYDNT